MPPVAPLDSNRAVSHAGLSNPAVSTHQAEATTTSAPDTRDAARAQFPASRNATGQRFDNNKLRARLNSPLPSKMTQLALDVLANPTQPRADNVVDMARHEDLVSQLDMNATRATLHRQNRIVAAEHEQHLQGQLKDATGATAFVDLSAIGRNYSAAAAKLGPNVTKTAVVKADGYRLGSVKLAETLIRRGCKDFFVARIGEAVELRQGLRASFPEMADKVAINVLDGNLSGADPQLLIDHKITPVLNSLEQVREWNAAAAKRGVKLPAILQFDSGMHRAGMRGYELEELLQDKAGNMGQIKTQFIMSHLAKSDEATQREDGSFQAGDATERQLENFDAIARQFPGVKASLGASSTVLLDAKFHKDYVRLGAAFHAQDPIDGADNPYEPVLTLKSKISEVHHEPAGVDLGYGGRYTTTRPTDVALIPIGYADGPPRAVAGNTPQPGRPPAEVIVKAHNDDGTAATFRCPMIGATSMDSSMIDVTDIPENFRRAGMEVILMGEGITPNQYGAMYGTNPSETQTKLAPRVAMEYKEDDGADKPKLDPTPSVNAWTD